MKEKTECATNLLSLECEAWTSQPFEFGMWSVDSPCKEFENYIYNNDGSFFYPHYTHIAKTIFPLILLQGFLK